MEEDLVKLEEAVEARKKDHTDQTEEDLEECLLHCIRRSRSVIIDGEPIDGKQGHYNPSGINADGGFWFAVWTSESAAAQGRCMYPVQINIRALARALKNNGVAGFALNPKPHEPFLTVPADVLENMLSIADRETARFMN